MPKKRLYLDEDNVDFVLIRWGFAWKNTCVVYENEELGRFKNQKELRKGGEFQLPGDRKLWVQLVGRMVPQLEVRLDGRDLEGSGGDPQVVLNQIMWISVIIGILNVALGVLAEALGFEIILNMGIGWPTALFGAALIGLGIAVKNGRSAAALGVLVGLIMLSICWTVYDSLATVQDTGETSSHTVRSGIIVRLIMLIYFFRGFAAIKKLKGKQVDALDGEI